MSSKYFVVIRHRKTRDAVKTMGPMSEAKAERVLNGVLLKLSDDYWADVEKGKEANEA